MPGSEDGKRSPRPLVIGITAIIALVVVGVLLTLTQFDQESEESARRVGPETVAAVPEPAKGPASGTATPSEARPEVLGTNEPPASGQSGEGAEPTESGVVAPTEPRAADGSATRASAVSGEGTPGPVGRLSVASSPALDHAPDPTGSTTEAPDIASEEPAEVISEPLAQGLPQPDRPSATTGIATQAPDIAGEEPAEMVSETVAPGPPQPDRPPATISIATQAPDITGVGPSKAVSEPSVPAPPSAREPPAQAGRAGLISDLAAERAVAALEPPERAPQPIIKHRSPRSAPKGVAPSFDVVRVAPDGVTVIAGRAEPGAQVSILDRDQVLGTVTADRRGEWVFIPDLPLPPGSRELGLVAKTAEGVGIESQEVVVLMIPENRRTAVAELAGAEQSPLAVLVAREGIGGSRLLQRPQPNDVIRLIAELGLTLDIINYDMVGDIEFSGRGRPGNRIVGYINNRWIGTAMVTGDGT